MFNTTHTIWTTLFALCIIFFLHWYYRKYDDWHQIQLIQYVQHQFQHIQHLFRYVIHQFQYVQHVFYYVLHLIQQVLLLIQHVVHLFICMFCFVLLFWYSPFFFLWVSRVHVHFVLHRLLLSFLSLCVFVWQTTFFLLLFYLLFCYWYVFGDKIININKNRMVIVLFLFWSLKKENKKELK